MGPRFLGDYGIVFVLLALVAMLSVLTLDEQHPTGTAAGAELAEDIVRDTQPKGSVLIVVRNTREDAEFADALRTALVEHGRTVLGPFQRDRILGALEKTAQEGTRPDVVAAVHAAGMGPVLDNVRQKHRPLFDQTRLMVPRSYQWPNFIKTTNLLNIINQVAVIAIIAIGMTMVIITGGIDLSVGSLMALSAVLTAALIRDVMGGYEASGPCSSPAWRESERAQSSAF
jgi:ribose transport system permease protein